jgi:hypothetical protein
MAAGDVLLMKYGNPAVAWATWRSVGDGRAVHAYPGIQRQGSRARARGALPQVPAAQHLALASPAMPINFAVKLAATVADGSGADGSAGEQADQGPRLDELTVTTSEYGTPLPRFLGARKFACPSSTPRT